ncbi:MAG TPA: hypothetical protein VF519_01640 [Mycobacteriales bacterium]|jgi:hypothetical protein
MARRLLAATALAAALVPITSTPASAAPAPEAPWCITVGYGLWWFTFCT